MQNTYAALGAKVSMFFSIKNEAGPTPYLKENSLDFFIPSEVPSGIKTRRLQHREHLTAFRYHMALMKRFVFVTPSKIF